jgi:hypothetical protein
VLIHSIELFAKLSGIVGMLVRMADRRHIRPASGAVAAAAAFRFPDIPVEASPYIQGADRNYEKNKQLLHNQNGFIQVRVSSFSEKS